MSAPNADLSRGGVALFVRRPVLAFVLSALILIAGLASLLGVEVRELPNVDRPVLTVSAQFDGASPETVDREITARIEGAIGRVPGVVSISSSSRFGRSRVTAEFGGGVDLDAAAADARDAVARIRNSLPEDADEPRIVKADDQSDSVMRLAVTSPMRSAADLTELVRDRVEDRLVAVPGVADVQINGARDKLFRVDIDPAEMASRGLTLADLRAALASAAFDSPAGSMVSRDQDIVVRTTAALATPEEFEAILLGEGVRLGDVANVTLGPDRSASATRANGETGIGIGIIRQAQSNTLEVSDGVRAAAAQLATELPEDVSVFVTSDDAVFIRGAIREVVITLALAAGIVVAVIFLFLRDWRATLIPTVTIPVALVGTLAAIHLAGFSVNILTLLALVLATGIVVDDAIVVLENIVRRRAEGMGPRAAAVLGTRQVFFAVIATTATLAAVFVPLSFLPGQVGGLFREFGFTLAISVLLSAVAALTLTPVMAARLLGPRAEPEGAEAGLLARLGAAAERGYARSLRAALDAPLVVAALAALAAWGAWALFGDVRRELTPPEDRAIALVNVTAPQGVSLDYTGAKMREVEARLQPLRDSGEVRNLFLVTGLGDQANRGLAVITLAPWGERERGQSEIVADVNAALRQVVGVQANAAQPNSLGIRGAGQGLRFAVLGSEYGPLAEEAEALAARMRADPLFADVRLNYEPTQPQLFVEVDRRRASDLGIAIDGLGEALQGMLDGRTVTTVFVGDQSYDVKLASLGAPVNDPSDLEAVFIRAAGGAMVPLSSIVSLEERAVPPELGREEQQRAVAVTATLREGAALGDALARAEALAAPLLGPGRIVPLAEAATLTETSRGLAVTFGFAVVIVLLVLAAQFESFVSAAIVMAAVPLGLACAVFALWASGTSLNVYSQIGLVLLVGVMAKNGILIVEFADQLRDEGASVREAIERGTRIRLRPVLMTMIATVAGGVPLIYSHGPGAEAREALGWMIVGGLGLATAATLWLTPVAYLLLAGLSKPRAAEERRLAAELAAVDPARL